MRTVLLLICSNIFMTLAWYGHLRKGFEKRSMILVILVSWLIALPEYALQIPANRIGHRTFTAPQLKIMQEAISIVVFLLFSIVYLGEKPSVRDIGAFALILGGVALALWPFKATPLPNGPPAP
jgi:uncharacterized protein (DUF486 family)